MALLAANLVLFSQVGADCDKKQHVTVVCRGGASKQETKRGNTTYYRCSGNAWHRVDCLTGMTKYSSKTGPWLCIKDRWVKQA